MRCALLLVALLLLPGMEVYTLFGFFESAPLAAALYLAAAAGGGWLLMRAAKVGVAETLRRFGAEGGRPGALLLFGKLWTMGALLFFPGYITDALALLLLAAPGSFFPDKNARRNDGENEWDEVDGREEWDENDGRGGGKGRRAILEIEGREEKE